ncbi:hypothetical protein H4I96_02588 [Botrytis cinerea]
MSKPSDFIDSFTNFWSDVAMLKPTPSVKGKASTSDFRNLQADVGIKWKSKNHASLLKDSRNPQSIPVGSEPRLLDPKTLNTRISGDLTLQMSAA